MIRCIGAALIFYSFLLVPFLSANPSFFRSGEPDCIGVLVHNDSFGPGPVSEWDDTRTFGVEVLSPVTGRFIVEAAYDLLTWRGMNADEAGRIDVARALIGWRPPDIPIGSFLLDARVEAGVEVVGNLAGIRLQESLHEAIRVFRPFPQTYDPFSAVAPAAAAAARLRWEDGVLGAALLASAEGELGVGVRGGAGIRLWAGSDGGHIGLTIRALVDPVRGVSPTLDWVSINDTGAIVGLDCAAGWVKTFLEFNLSTGVSNGGYGLEFDLGSARSPGALPVGVEVFCAADCYAPGQCVLLPLGDPRVRFYASQSAGWWTPLEGGLTGLRFADHGVGVEGRVLTGRGSMEGEAAISAGAFFCVVTRQTLDEARSTTLGASWSAGLRVEPSFRVGILDKGDDGHIRKGGIGIGCVLNVPVYASSTMAVRTAGLKLFAFGETR